MGSYGLPEKDKEAEKNTKIEMKNGVKRKKIESYHNIIN